VAIASFTFTCGKWLSMCSVALFKPSLHDSARVVETFSKPTIDDNVYVLRQI
jgi:hypothetical protein